MRQTNNQLQQIEQMYQQYQQLNRQLNSWRYDPIRNMTDVSNKMQTILNAGKSLHGAAETGSTLLADISGDPNLANTSYFDTLSASLNALDEQNKLFKADASGFDHLQMRLNTDVTGGTSAIGALANMNEAVLNHIDDLNQKMSTMVTNEVSKAIKEQTEKVAQEESLTNLRRAFVNAKLEDEGNWDWTKFHPIYTSNHQEQV